MNGFKLAFWIVVAASLFSVAVLYERFGDNGRFQPVTTNMALDTRHGTLCYAYDPLPITNPGKEPLFPLCKDVK